MTEPIASWLNKTDSRTFPDWVKEAMVGQRAPNGTFLINAKRGQVRVHVGHMVFRREGEIFCCHPAESRQLVAQLEEEARGFAHLKQLNPKPGAHPRTLEADVADRTDDTDEISRRIRAEAPVRFATQVAPLVPQAAAAVPAPVDVSTARHRTASFSEPKSAKSKWPAPLGMPPSIEMRHPTELKVDDSYQRSIDTGPSRALIDRIARGWDWRMCLPLVVSKREGGFYVIDGQHRHAAALKRGDIPFLPCCVAVFRDVAEEAAMFVAMNRSRRAMNRLDDFHAAQAGGDEVALAITAMVEAVGFTVSRRTGSAAWAPGEVAFTSAIAKVYRRADWAAREALEMMAKVFFGQRLVAGSSVFTALAAVLTSPPSNFDRGRLLVALRTFDMKGWAEFLDQSRGGTDRSKHLKDMLLAAYDDAGKVIA